MPSVDDALVTWLGHATALIDLGGERVLVDPLGRRRCRKVTGQYRAVLITHAHIDHLNRWTLKKVDKDVTLMVPKGATPIVADLGFREVVEVEPGDQLAVGKLDVISVPTKHDRGRWRKGDRPDCTGYVIARGGHAVHHAGDVDMSTYDVFERIGREFALDATLLPIGGMLPTWYYRMRNRALDRGIHIDPDTALEIAQRMGAPRMIPVHWGTLNLRLGQLASAPMRRLSKVAAEADASHLVHLLRHGQSLSLAAPVETRDSDEAGDGDGDADERAEDLVARRPALGPEASEAK
jgi:L-ascorbate metabolism protein UlaG (beta-lactamase superfamily)